MQGLRQCLRLHLQGDQPARLYLPKERPSSAASPHTRSTPVPLEFHCLAYTCWDCAENDEFYKPRICVCRRYARDPASVPVEKACQRAWPPARNRKRKMSEPQVPRIVAPRLPRLGDRVNLIESADIKACPGCNSGARQSICRGMPMRMSEFQEWPFPGACDLWECSNVDCNYWGGVTGLRRECSCLGVGDLCIAHGCDAWPNGQDGYIAGTAYSMDAHPSQSNPITYRFVVYGDGGYKEMQLRRSLLALHLVDGDPFPKASTSLRPIRTGSAGPT